MYRRLPMHIFIDLRKPFPVLRFPDEAAPGFYDPNYGDPALER